MAGAFVAHDTMMVAGSCTSFVVPDDFRIVVDAKEYTFEWHAYCGPMPTTKRGDERKLGSRHRFWKAVTWWNMQGREVKDGLCAWRVPRPPKLKHLGGRHYEIVEDGEPGWDI